MKSGKKKYILVKYGQLKIRIYGSAAVFNADAMVESGSLSAMERAGEEFGEKIVDLRFCFEFERHQNSVNHSPVPPFIRR